MHQEERYDAKFSVMLAVSVSALGLIYGYDTGNIGGALPYLKKEFGLSTLMTEWVTSVVVLGAILGALSGGKTANAIGRQKTLLLVVIGFAIFAALSALAASVFWLLVVRFLLGVTIGVTITVAPVFISEVSPTKIRGAMLVTFQIATTIGIASAFFTDLAFSFSENWRAMLGVSAIPALLLIAVILRFPDTPRWYAMKGDREKALRILGKMQPQDKIQDEIRIIDDELSQNNKGNFSELFLKKYRKGTLFVLGLGFFVQITGINAIIYYGPIIFQHAGISNNSTGILIVGVSQLIALLAETTSFLIIDRLGRRKTLLSGISFMVLANIIMMAVFIAGFSSAWSVSLAVLGIVVFRIGYSLGFGSLVWVYASETLPSSLRSLGSSALLTVNLIANLVVGLTFLSFLNMLGGFVVFGIFLFLCISAWLFVLALAPETKGKSLEDINLYWENGGHWEHDTADNEADGVVQRIS